MEGLAAQNQLAAAGAGVNYGQVGGGCVRSGPARRPGEKAFVSLFRLRSVPSARGAARDRHAPGAARGRAAPTATRALTFEPPLASLPPHQVDVHPRVHRKRPADAPGVAPRELVPSRGALRGAPILPPRLRPQPGRRGRGPRGGPGRGTERAEHVHQRVRPPPLPSRRPRTAPGRDDPATSETSAIEGTSAVPFSARVPRRMMMMMDRSRLRERGFARIDILGSRPGRAPRGGAGTNGGPARSRLGVLPLVLPSPPPREGAPATGFFDPFRSLSPKKSFEHLSNERNASPRVRPPRTPRVRLCRPPRALTPYT
jgi:hypothetical protein